MATKVGTEALGLPVEPASPDGSEWVKFDVSWHSNDQHHHNPIPPSPPDPVGSLVIEDWDDDGDPIYRDEGRTQGEYDEAQRMYEVAKAQWDRTGGHFMVAGVRTVVASGQTALGGVARMHVAGDSWVIDDWDSAPEIAKSR